jgi:two-component system, cell cycle sensor histidine kinase and response regulator CckA
VLFQLPAFVVPSFSAFRRVVFGCLLLPCGVLFAPAQTPPSPKSVATIDALHALSAKEFLSSRSVAFEGVALVEFPGTGHLFVQDGERGIFVVPPEEGEPVELGSRISVTGVTGSLAPRLVVAEVIEVLDTAPALPTAIPVGVLDVLKDRVPTDTWLELSGMVQSARIVRGRARLRLRFKGEVISVSIPAPAALPQRIDFSDVAIRCVLVPGTGESAATFVAGAWSDVEMTRRGPPSAFRRGPVPVKELLDLSRTKLRTRAMVVRGRVFSRLAGGDFILADDTGRIRVSTLTPADVSEGDMLNAAGFTSWEDPEIYLAAARLQRLGLTTDRTGGTNSVAITNFIPVIEVIAGIHGLDRAEIMAGQPVSLTGVVTYRSVQTSSFRMMQNHLGIEVQVPGTNSLPGFGDRVLVRGHTSQFGEKVVVGSENVQVLATNMEPETVPAFRLGFDLGRQEDLFLEVSNVVRRVEQADEHSAWIHLHWKKKDLRVRVNLAGSELPTDFVDALVRVRGVAHTLVVPGRKVAENVLLVDSMAGTEVLEEAPENPFEVVINPISLMHLKGWTESELQRKLIVGMVTLRWPGRIYVEDGSGGIEVRVHDDEVDVQVGDLVRVVGFPQRTDFCARLLYAEIRHTGKAPLAPAIPLDTADVLASDVNNRRIQLTGLLVGTTPAPGFHLLVLQSGERTYTARMPNVETELPDWRAGSTLQVSGVCEFRSEAGLAPDSFRILLGSADGVRVLKAASWWNLGHSLAVVGAMFVVVLGAMAWVARLRRRVQESRTQFQRTFHSNPMAAGITSIATRCYLDVNPAFERLYGCGRVELIGKTPEELGVWASPDDRERLVKAVQKEGSVTSFEARLNTKSGGLVSVLLSAEPIHMDGEDCLLIMGHNVTERLKLLEQLRQSQKMEAVGQLAAGVAHDFNNLLTIIRGNAELLAGTESLDEEALELTEEVNSAATRAAELTKQLLAFSRKQVMRRSLIDLNDAVTKSVGMLRRLLGETIQVEPNLAPSELLLEADGSMLDQVLMNLAVNARDAMVEGGVLKISTSEVTFDDGSKPKHPDAATGRFAVLAVKDDGCGMSSQVLEHVFDPFFTTKDVGKGSGLGLSTVYGILRQHGGWITAESDETQGTIFTIYLPMARGQLAEPSIPQSSVVEIEGTETILVVEDSAPLKLMVRRALSKRGYHVLEAEDGPSAQEAWAKFGHRVDLLLTDMVMPNGLTGMDLSLQFKGDRPNLKVIYMSGYSSELVEHGNDLVAGVNFIAKPFESGALAEVIRQRLDEKPETAQDNPVAE